MNFKDMWAVDEDGEEFVFTVEMQRQLGQRGLPVEPAYVKELHGSAPARPAPSRPFASRPPDRPQPREVEAPPQSAPSPDILAPETIQIDPQTGKYIGRMKWYNVKKGYGFIVRGGGEEIFFHKTGTIGDPLELQEGQWILYDVEETHKGPEATDVEPYTGDTELLA
jgi:CspA family cold shock protein